MANSTSTSHIPPTLANRLSRTVPQYLVRLAHEPSVGLHFVALHAQSRAAPRIASGINKMENQCGKFSEVILDTRDATETMSVHGASSIDILERISKSLAVTKECIDQYSQS